MASQIFNQELFQIGLKTREIGRRCLYFDKVPTTIDVAAKEKHGTLVIAGEQTNGRGQRNNQWISPQGCAMGSVKLECPKSGPLGERVCFLQRIMALPAVWTLEKIDGSKMGRDKVGLKWPYDIIYGVPNGNQKLGGVLVMTQDK